MTPVTVKPKISNFKVEKSCQVNFNMLRRFYHERLLSESSHSYMLAFRMYAI
jgi:hypothetical protein